MLLTPGYWHNTYWAESYWNDDFWAEYGTYVPPVLESIFIIDIDIDIETERYVNIFLSTYKNIFVDSSNEVTTIGV